MDSQLTFYYEYDVFVYFLIQKGINDKLLPFQYLETII